MEKSTIDLIAKNCKRPFLNEDGNYVYEFDNDNCIEILDNGIEFWWYDKDDYGGDSAKDSMIIGKPLEGYFYSNAPICTENDIVWYLKNKIFKL